MDEITVQSYLIALLAGYAIGSFPTAYLLVKWRHNTDIRKAGSGNVGTLNSYEVTGSKRVGIVVLIVDFFKGVAAVLIAGAISGDGFAVGAAACLGAVIGHNFPVWLGFKGGRGLATAAGGVTVLGWILLPIWLVSWYIGNKIFKDVNLGNTVATLSLLIGAVFVPVGLLLKALAPATEPSNFRIFVVLLALIILSRLIQPVAEYFSQRRKKG